MSEKGAEGEVAQGLPGLLQHHGRGEQAVNTLLPFSIQANTRSPAREPALWRRGRSCMWAGGRAWGGGAHKQEGLTHGEIQDIVRHRGPLVRQLMTQDIDRQPIGQITHLVYLGHRLSDPSTSCTSDRLSVLNPPDEPDQPPSPKHPSPDPAPPFHLS